jgi:hypothetical protein
VRVNHAFLDLIPADCRAAQERCQVMRKRRFARATLPAHDDQPRMQLLADLIQNVTVHKLIMTGIRQSRVACPIGPALRMVR